MGNPFLTSIDTQNAHMIKVTFSEAVGDSALNPANYQLSGTGQGTLPDYPDFVERIDATNYNLIWISAGINKNITGGQSVTLDAIVPGTGPYQYLWSPTTGLDDATIINPTATPTETTEYTLTVARVGESLNDSGAITDSVEVKMFYSSITDHNITWTFDRPYECGQFVTGDWWIIGPATISSVSPAPVMIPDSLKTGTPLRLRNGSMVNPIPGVYSQSYDQRATGWSTSTVVSFPLFLNVNKSLVSSESYAEGATRPHSSFLKSACVLTCLSSRPDTGSFRPAFNGTTKTVYSSYSVNKNLLPNLTPVSLAENKGIISNIETLLPLINRPWLDHMNGAGGIYVYPDDNMLNYGRELSNTVGRAACLLLLDEQQIGDKTDLLNALIQNGIDHYGTLISGGTWPEDGGHCSGRKFPILFAGLMLDDSGMLSVGTAYPPSSNTFGDDSQTFLISESDIGRELLITGTRTILTNCCSTKGYIICPDSCVTTSTEICFKCSEYNSFEGNYLHILDGAGAGQQRLITTQVYRWIGEEQTVKLTLASPLSIIPAVGDHFTFLGYQASSIGIGEWGGAHITYPTRDNPSWKAHYRCSSTSVCWNGWILAARVLGLKTEWNHDAIFEYIDRYMTGGTGTCAAQGYRSWSEFTARMWDAYRSSY